MPIWDEILGTNPLQQAQQETQAAQNASHVTPDDLVFYPRAYVSLSITLEGTDELDTGVIPLKASVSLKPHNQASEATVTVMGSALPFDPRQVAGGFVTLFMGAVDQVDSHVNELRYRRFCGFIDEMETKRGDKTQVELKCRDMSAILRDFHPLPASAVPSYSDTVQDAINGILSAVTGAQGRITLKSNDLTSRSLSGATSSRSQSHKIQLPQNASAWQAIEHVCGLVSLLVTIDLDQVVVKEPQTVYQNTDDATVTFVFGGDTANLLEVESTRKFVRNRKGVRATAYNPTTRTTLISDFPSDSNALPVRRPPSHVGGSSIRSQRNGSRRGGRGASNSGSGSTSDTATAVERDVFPAPQGIQTQDALDSYAQRIYTERSQQEIEGRIVCPVWTESTLSTVNGTRFVLQIDPDLSAELRNTTDRQAAIDLLKSRLDLTDDAASALIRASEGTPTDHWYARTVTHEFDGDGQCQTTVEYLNLIQVESSSDSQSSGASQGASTGTPQQRLFS